MTDTPIEYEVRAATRLSCSGTPTRRPVRTLVSVTAATKPDCREPGVLRPVVERGAATASSSVVQLLGGELISIGLGIVVAMTRDDRYATRDERIERRIVVDAYSPQEQATGWYAYLDDVLAFPFEACCIEKREVSPLQEGETVTVVGLPRMEPSPNRQLVTVVWLDRELGVPLSQLEPVEASDDTAQAIADWHYWIDR